VAWVSAEGVGVAPAIPTLGDRRASGHSIIGLAVVDRSTLRAEAIGRRWSQGRFLAWLADSWCPAKWIRRRILPVPRSRSPVRRLSRPDHRAVDPEWMDPGCHSPTRCPPSDLGTGSAPTLPGVTADRQARVADVHELALGLPHVTVVHGARGNAVYQVGGRSFVFFRTPRPDAVDAATGERLPDVIVFWVESEADKQALVQDETTPFFSTRHFDGHNSVLVQASRLGEITRQELAELVQDAWLAQASARRRAAWLAAHGTTPIQDPDATDADLPPLS
jgi:hypothetical protein